MHIIEKVDISKTESLDNEEKEGKDENKEGGSGSDIINSSDKKENDFLNLNDHIIQKLSKAIWSTILNQFSK